MYKFHKPFIVKIDMLRGHKWTLIKLHLVRQRLVQRHQGLLQRLNCRLVYIESFSFFLFFFEKNNRQLVRVVGRWHCTTSNNALIAADVIKTRVSHHLASVWLCCTTVDRRPHDVVPRRALVALAARGRRLCVAQRWRRPRCAIVQVGSSVALSFTMGNCQRLFCCGCCWCLIVFCFFVTLNR